MARILGLERIKVVRASNRWLLVGQEPVLGHTAHPDRRTIVLSGGTKWVIARVASTQPLGQNGIDEHYQRTHCA